MGAQPPARGFTPAPLPPESKAYDLSRYIKLTQYLQTAPSCLVFNSMKMADHIYHCQIPDPTYGVWLLCCRLRIFQPRPGIQTVLISDMGFEIGWFNPHIVEGLATQVIDEFQLDTTQLIWLEYCTPDSSQQTGNDFCQVTFEWHNGKATNPRWTAIAPEAARALINEELLLFRR